MKLPILSGNEVLNLLVKNGFIVKRQKGSHVFLFKKNAEGKGLYVTVPIHANKELLVKTLHSILRQAELTRADFVKLCE